MVNVTCETGQPFFFLLGKQEHVAFVIQPINNKNTAGHEKADGLAPLGADVDKTSRAEWFAGEM